MILGDAGIGKSHATQALARRLRTRGATVELVLATEAASTVPFGALAELLGPVAGVPGDVLEVLRSAGSRLAHRAHGGVLVVIVDDAHRLDVHVRAHPEAAYDHAGVGINPLTMEVATEAEPAG